MVHASNLDLHDFEDKTGLVLAKWQVLQARISLPAKICIVKLVVSRTCLAYLLSPLLLLKVYCLRLCNIEEELVEEVEDKDAQGEVVVRNACLP